MKGKLIEKFTGEVRSLLEGNSRAVEIFERIMSDEELLSLIDHANTVAILRWGYNDHGVVHALITTRNAVKMAKILHDRGMKLNCESEIEASFDDGLAAIVMSAMMHDVGNMVTRTDHEMLSAITVRDRVEKILRDMKMDIRLMSYVLEGIVCHMGRLKATSLEAKLISIADGLDMEEGRARIPYKLSGPDIHKFSALAIKRVEISHGAKKPIKITVEMSESAGTFQVEEVLMKKFRAAEFGKMAELYAKVNGEVIRYS